MTKNSDKAIELVYQTRNYNKFSSVKYNRDVKESRFEKLKASFEEKEILNPIIVNEYFEIIDGQGRFEVCKALGRPIKYVIAIGTNIDDCRRMNHYNMPWNGEDFIESYASAGIESYVRIKRIHDTTHLTYSMIRSILGTGSSKKCITNGNLVLSEEQEKFVYLVNKHGKELLTALDWKSKVPVKFYDSVRVLLSTKNYDAQRMIEKCKYMRNNFVMAATFDGILKEWSKVYNYKIITAKKIYFEDYLRNKGRSVMSYDDRKDAGYHFSRSQFGKSVKTLM